MNEKVIIIFPPDEVDMARKAGEKALAYDCGIDIFKPYEREELPDGSVQFSQTRGDDGTLYNIVRKLR
jgi:hypothetical protein